MTVKEQDGGLTRGHWRSRRTEGSAAAARCPRSPCRPRHLRAQSGHLTSRLLFATVSLVYVILTSSTGKVNCGNKLQDTCGQQHNTV